MVKRKGQEEMVGFALIMIIVAVIIMVFIGIMFSRPKGDLVESYEVQSFLQGLLQHNTDCEDGFGYVNIQGMVFKCQRNEGCLDGRNTCEVLSETIENVLEEFWKTDRGYSLNIYSEEGDIIEPISYGNVSRQYKTAIQPYSRGGETLYISFIAYS